MSRYFHNFVIISPWKRVEPFTSTNLSSLTQRCQVWLKLAQWFRRSRWKCEKFTTTTTRTDNRQILIRKAPLSLRLRWANKKQKAKQDNFQTFYIWILNSIYTWLVMMLCIKKLHACDLLTIQFVSQTLQAEDTLFLIL